MRELLMWLAVAVALAGWVTCVVAWVKWRVVRDDLRAEQARNSGLLDRALRAEKENAHSFAHGRLSAKQEIGL